MAAHKMYSKLFSVEEQKFAETLWSLSASNPFLTERIELERLALGSRFSEASPFWVPDMGAADLDDSQLQRPNLVALGDRAAEVAYSARRRFRALRGSPESHELKIYQDLCLYALFAKYEARLFQLSRSPELAAKPVGWYERFEHDYQQLLVLDGIHLPEELSPDVALALLFQLRRAFHYVFRYILGSSPVSARLRAETWNSIFTHNMHRYRRGLFRSMHDIPTLITGPTGSGKELVAQAIGLSRYIPFDASRRSFSEHFSDQYHPLHLAALPVSLVESELFGHRRGAFTGAVEDRIGWLESCGPAGTVFLDEVGELPGEVQVKLLRVIQARTFSRLGDSKSRFFLGKLVTATHRDLAAEMREQRFRPDLFHRLSADHIQAPALKERIVSDPRELEYLVGQLSRRIAGEAGASEVAEETLRFIDGGLGDDYEWPGNIREVEQCIRSVMVRGSYQPVPSYCRPGSSVDDALLSRGFTLDELIRHYSKLVYHATGSFAEAGRQLDIDRRTLKQYVSSQTCGSKSPGPKPPKKRSALVP